jgi:uncharacterized protein YjiK
MKSSIIVIILASTLLSFCQHPETKSEFPYHLNIPDETFTMPKILEEISGITLLNDSIMLCIQDENGILFYYDLKNKKLQKQIGFGKDADYEDLALVDDALYVLQSNGQLHLLKDFGNNTTVKTKIYKTALKRPNDCEGLCYDAANNRLLIALKEKPEISTSQNFENFRAVYAFDLPEKKLNPEPAVLIPLNKLHIDENDKLVKDKSNLTKFHPSAIEIHPLSGNIYILASKGQVLLVMNKHGEIIAFEKLSKKIFTQPEGLAFAADGTLYISNEGAGKFGNILKFEIKQPQ